MADLASVVLAAILSVARGQALSEPERLGSIAEDISAAVLEREEPVFTGEGGAVATALMLVAIAKHESEFQAKVDDCTRRGDTGRSITLFQILRGPNWGGHDADTICTDRRLAAKLALSLLARPLEKRPKATPQMLANAYATGSPGMQNTASKDICKLWEKLASGVGLKRAACGAHRSFAWPTLERTPSG